jgi:hypothetical protein
MNKIRLVESFKFDEDTEIDLFDKETLVESNGNTYTAKGIIKNIPVTNANPNRNGRIYPEKLWERVIKDRKAEGSK